jgi:hypothetical protein
LDEKIVKKMKKTPQKRKVLEEINTPEKNKKFLFKTPDMDFKKITKQKRVKINEGKSLSGKFGEVFIGKISPNMKFQSPNVAIKTQPIKQLKNENDTSYRELAILTSLSKLKKNNTCHGFIDLYDWYKSKGNLDQEKENLESEEESEEEIELKRKDPYMNFILEKADLTLSQYLIINKKEGIGLYKIKG